MMRYLVRLVCVLAGLVALPVGVSAQAGEEGTSSEPNLQEPAPRSEPAPEEPRCSSAGRDRSGCCASPPPTVDGYTLEETQLRVKRARIGLLSSAGAFLVGIPFLIAAGTRSRMPISSGAGCRSRGGL